MVSLLHLQVENALARNALQQLLEEKLVRTREQVSHCAFQCLNCNHLHYFGKSVPLNSPSKVSLQQN